MTEVHAKPIAFQAMDGWPLKGDLYRCPQPTYAVLISAGTGFPRRFYRHMASHLAQKGAVVLTYDYRGIGDSRNGPVAGSDIDLPDWGRYDMPAAVEALTQAAPGLPVTHVAHSVGGHFLGLMPNHHKITRNAFIAVSTGYIGHHAPHYRPMEAYFWWGLGTYSLMRHGCLKPVGGWRGEALPPKVFKTWRRWSHRRTYFQTDLETMLAPQHYDKVRSPIHSWLFTDDPIATRKASQILLQTYPNAPRNGTVKSPADLGVKRIGHEGAFKPGRERLWDEVHDWLSDADVSSGLR